jgi:polysaccharide export outer membrane protein
MTKREIVHGAGVVFLVLAAAACAGRTTPAPGASPLRAEPSAQALVSQNPVSQDTMSQDTVSQDRAPQDARVRRLWQARGSAAEENFCLGRGDLVDVSVARVDEMQGLRARVSPTGTITLPHVGAIQASGLTETELRERIRQRLGQTLLRDPQVNLFVTEYASQQVSVTGAVARPGLYGLSRQTRTVSDLLSEAGGMSEHAGGTVQFYPGSGEGCSTGVRPRAISAPGAPAGGTPIQIDLNREWRPPSENPLNLPVVGGDAIVVNSGRYFVDGWVHTPGAYDLTPGTTAMGGLTAAGGAMFPADLHGVVVWRTGPGGTKQRIDLDVDAVREGEAKDLTLEGGDVVSVPASTAKMVPYAGYWILTNVVRVGAGLSLPVF